VPCIRSDLLLCVYRRVKELEEALSQTKATNQATQLENDQLKVCTTSPVLFTCPVGSIPSIPTAAMLSKQPRNASVTRES